MRDIDCKLIICGKGPESKKLGKMVSNLGLESKVELRGYVSDEEKDALIDSCKLFVIPSIFESFGLAALEVTSHGKPLVFSKVNGLPETVGEGGIGVEPKDPKAIADAVNSLLNDDALRREKGIAARRHAETYVWDRHLDVLEDTLFGH